MQQMDNPKNIMSSLTLSGAEDIKTKKLAPNGTDGRLFTTDVSAKLKVT